MAKQHKVPTYPGQGRIMQIQGSLAVLVSAVFMFGGLATSETVAPLAYFLWTIGIVIAAAGVYRNYRGAIFQRMETQLGSRLFQETTE